MVGMRMRDKVVVITGGGSGLGRECAFLMTETGASVVVSDHIAGRADSVAAEITINGGRAIAVDADVRVESQVERLLAAAVEEYGRVDVVLANAGTPEAGFGRDLDTLSLDEWNTVLETNLTGAFLTFKHSAQHMIRQGRGGSIVATSSAAASFAYPGFSAYSASKAGLEGLVRSAAFAWGRYGIRVNALSPTHGMSVNFALDPEAEVIGKSYEEVQGWDPERRAMPLRLDRPPTLRDNANAVMFLASDDAAYMSGQCLHATDGATHARVAIVFPEDLGQESEGSVSSILPPGFDVSSVLAPTAPDEPERKS